MLGFLLVRSVGEALDELAALVSLYSSPGADHRRPAGAPRAGRPPSPTPYAACCRRGGCPTGTASTSSATWRPPPPTRRPTWPSGAGPRPPSATRRRWPPGGRARSTTRRSYDDTGLVARFLTNPVAVALAALRGARPDRRARRRSATVTGGGLSPAPDRRRRLVAAAPRVLAPARPRHRRPGAAVRRCRSRSSPRCSAPPADDVGAARARRAVRAVGRLAVPPRGRPAGQPAAARRAGCCCGARRPTPWSRWSRAPGATAGSDRSWSRRRAALAGPRRARLRRPGRPTGAGAPPGGPGCCSPWSLPFAPGRVALRADPRRWSCVAAASRSCRGAVRDRSVWGPPATALGVVPVLLAPWWLPAVLDGAARGAVPRHRPAGRRPSVDALDLLAGRFGGLGAPWWLGVVLAVLALAALVPRATRIAVAGLLDGRRGRRGARRRCSATITLVADRDRRPRPDSGSCVVVLQALLRRRDGRSPGCAPSSAASGSAPRCRCSRSWAWPPLVPLVGLGWWFSRRPTTALADDRDAGIPAYMVQSAETGAGARHPGGPRRRRERPDLHRPPGRRRHDRRGRDHRPAGRGRRVRPPPSATLASRPTPEVVDDPGRPRDRVRRAARARRRRRRPRRSTRPAAWSRRAPRTAPPAPGR